MFKFYTHYSIFILLNFTLYSAYLASFGDHLNLAIEQSQIDFNKLDIPFPLSSDGVLNAVNHVVVSLKKIDLKAFPYSHNPSIVTYGDGFLLTFRYLPNPFESPWISYIGIVELNALLEPTSQPQLLDTRIGNHSSPSQSEDARIFLYQGEYYLLFNDNYEETYPSFERGRRDMFISKLSRINGKFSLSPALKLFHPHKYPTIRWQKNWVPFEWNGALLMSYSINPHEVLHTNLQNGECYPLYQTAKPIKWKWGELRGGTTAELIDGEYLAFFHSLIFTISEASHNRPMWHYYTGAYTFSSEPPFELKKISALPIIAEGLYTKSIAEKRVIFPGGFTVSDDYIYLAYGKDDMEVWVATIDKSILMNSLTSANESIHNRKR